MSVFDAVDFDSHEKIAFCSDPGSGLKAIIAIHNTTRGPALGGCRMWAYDHEDDALTDALRLSRGMTYKAAICGLDLGGGKAVIIGDPKQHKSPALMRSMGRAVERLAGRYIIAEDVGTTVDDMAEIRKETHHVSGLPADLGGTGDPSPTTAKGVFMGMKAAADHAGWRGGLAGRTVAVQGLGSVGSHLCRLLVDAGARLIVTDLHDVAVEQAVREFGATAVAPDEIYGVEADVYAPCALGGTLNDETIPRLKVWIVAGSANNPLATASHGDVLRRRAIIYAPDYVINSGGLITVAEACLGHDAEATNRKIEGIYDVTRAILDQAERQDIATSLAADRIAEERFRRHGPALAA